jgi:hypothetical protein
MLIIVVWLCGMQLVLWRVNYNNRFFHHLDTFCISSLKLPSTEHIFSKRLFLLCYSLFTAMLDTKKFVGCQCISAFCGSFNNFIANVTLRFCHIFLYFM